jgi:HK97 family phage portal protein
VAFWTSAINWLNNTPTTPNDNGPEDLNPGDPDGLEFTGDKVEARALPLPFVSPWDGWPTGWQTPDWKVNTGINRLADIAWACLDMSSNIVSAMPVYRLKNGRIIEPKTWMSNPDPTIYNCWGEFFKQLFWDFQLGEAFVMPWGSMGSDNYPVAFRVIPPWLMTVEMERGQRIYHIGAEDVTDRILHIRYSSNTTHPRGVGPLEIAGARMTTIALLQKYTTTLAQTGGVPLYWMELQRRITETEGRDLMDRWIESRIKNAGQPALVSGGATLNQARTMDAKEMALLELSQFSESRIAVLLGIPPFLVGLAGASGSLTYSNISDLFDFHDRSSLRPKSKMVMDSISGKFLPLGQSVELNRDDYTRLPLDKRAAIYKELGPVETGGIGALTIDEIRIMERYYGSTAGTAAQALTGSAD